MHTNSRIPDPLNNSFFAMNRWFAKMQASGLLFHPEDRAKDIVEVASGKAIFSSEECCELDKIIDAMFEKHGEQVCEVAYKFFRKDFLKVTTH
jgi:hypothetical protein